MQPMNMRSHVFPMGDQFFSPQQNDQQANVRMNAQVFSPQMKQTSRLYPQQPGMMQGLPGMASSRVVPDVSNSFHLKPKMDPSLGQAPVPLQQQQQQQAPQHPAFSVPNAANLAPNGPPGIGGISQGPAGLARPGNNTVPKHIATAAAAPIVLTPPNHLFIREVWLNNLHAEFASIRKLITQYNYVSISTEFVGTIARPIGNFRSKTDYHYQTMRSNVDFLNPIQIGLSLCDASGNKPESGPSTWQFNFCFDESKEMMSQESFELLQKSGINFHNHKTNGIDPFEFAQLMIDSGLLLETSVTWLTYHAAYDFGFLINILMNNDMPNNREDFEWWVHKFIPNFYDLNLICKVMQDSKQQQPTQQQKQYTLSSLAEELGIPRYSLFLTTGGESLLTGLCFFQLNKLLANKMPNGTNFSSYRNLIYGINGE
ncbi:hypothetical protein HG537_0F00220 [Torulaspora globosa]|uniref:poly(A)-specific ribonuclease n=1 Tax=Torulaspora globosa TaxID=48254 RepID=A0A7H9HV72_9SACH|nr:hypothetical protein HG537_0F00220 [Torulaspora sp. CBS 2947]